MRLPGDRLRPRRADRDRPAARRRPATRPASSSASRRLDAVVPRRSSDSSAHADRFDPKAARRQAVLFRKERFEDELFGFLDRVMLGERREVRQAA